MTQENEMKDLETNLIGRRIRTKWGEFGEVVIVTIQEEKPHRTPSIYLGVVFDATEEKPEGGAELIPFVHVSLIDVESSGLSQLPEGVKAV
jgi:hypothetical protein